MAISATVNQDEGGCSAEKKKKTREEKAWKKATVSRSTRNQEKRSNHLVPSYFSPQWLLFNTVGINRIAAS